MVGSSKIDADVPGQPAVEFPCSIWTRKYPAGWDGIYLNEAGKLVNHEFNSRSRNLVWMYSAAACVVMQGVEKRIECVVPQKVVEFNGGQIDLEPAWEGVVNALKEECIRRVQGVCTFQQPQVTGQAFWRQGFQQQVFSQQVLPPQMLMQLANIENHLPPKNIPRRTQKTPKKSKKEQVPCPPQQASPFQKFVSHALERSTSDVGAFTSGNNMKTPNSGTEYQTAVPQREGHFEHPHLGHPLGWADGPILPGFGRPYQEGIGGPSAQEAVEAHGQENNVPSQVVQPISHSLQNNDNSLEQGDQSKPKRKRAPANKKQPTQVVQELSGQSDQVAEAETPPASGKAGTKRKNSISTRTPAKKTISAKTGATTTPVTKTPTAKMPATKTPSSKTPATKTPAKKRGRPPKEAVPSSEVRDDGSETGEASETEDGMRGNVSEQQVRFGPPLPSDPSTGFETQQRRMSQSVQNHGFTANPTNQPQMSLPVWNNPQKSNPFDLHGSSAIKPHFQASQIYHQIRNIDAEQIRLFRSCPNVIVNPAGYLECQHQIGELGRMRDALSSMMPAHLFPMYPMAWNNGFQPNYGLYPTHQNDGQVHLNGQVFPVQQNDGFQYGSSQMSSMQQNNGSCQPHSQMSGPQWYNDSEGSSIPGTYLPSATLSFTQPGEFQQEAQATVTLPNNSAISNMNVGGPGPNLNIPQSTTSPTPQYPSPTQIGLAEFPEEQVQRARSSVKLTLEKPFHGLSTSSSWTQQQEGDDRMTGDDLGF
jgi:hypothetical protein